MINPGYIPDKSGIWDKSGIYPGYIYIPDKSWIHPKYIPKYILNIFGIYSQIYLGLQGWGVPNHPALYAHRRTAWGVQKGRRWPRAAHPVGGPPLKRLTMTGNQL
jgi:hypothetical protein